MTTLGVPLDFVVGSETDPMRQRAILPLLFRERSLGSESLLGRLQKNTKRTVRSKPEYGVRYYVTDKKNLP